MKKATVSILALVLVVSLSLVAFVACNPKDSEKASNSEVLGTTVAVLASNMAGGASAAAEDNADVHFNAGVNIQVGDNNQLSLGAEAVATGIGTTLKPMIQGMVDRLDTVLSENGIKVEKVESTDAEYTEKYSITITYVDDATGKEEVRELALYVKLSEGAELEGKKDYTFEAKVTYVKKQPQKAKKTKNTLSPRSKVLQPLTKQKTQLSLPSAQAQATTALQTHLQTSKHTQRLKAPSRLKWAQAQASAKLSAQAQVFRLKSANLQTANTARLSRQTVPQA